MHSGPNDLSLVMLVSNVEKKKKKETQQRHLIFPRHWAVLPSALSSQVLSKEITEAHKPWLGSLGPDVITILDYSDFKKNRGAQTMQRPILQGSLDLGPIIGPANYFREEMYGLVQLRGMNTQYHFFGQLWARFWTQTSLPKTYKNIFFWLLRLLGF